MAMFKYISILILILFVSCAETGTNNVFDNVAVETLYSDSLSIRAITIMDEGSLAFAANKGTFGLVNLRTNAVRLNVQQYDSLVPEFRAVANTATDFFMLSAGNPALLYKTGDIGSMQLVYKEEDERVFYDAMTFWNNREGIAIGDSMDGCLSILITRDGGHNWKKIPCSSLPKTTEGEGAFAASNTNVKVIGDKTWIATTNGNIHYSPDKGGSWEIWPTPIASRVPTEGIYSLDFYDENLGFVMGGDYTDPDNDQENKARTTDGGRTWKLVASGFMPDYRSCVQYVPNSGGRSLVALGFKGIAYSNDYGESWKQLSDEPFYTFRFLNDSIAYAAGANRIAKLSFR